MTFQLHVNGEGYLADLHEEGYPPIGTLYRIGRTFYRVTGYRCGTKAPSLESRTGQGYDVGDRCMDVEVVTP